MVPDKSGNRVGVTVPSRVSIIGWILIAQIATIMIQSEHNMKLVPTMIFSAMIIIHAGLHWHSMALVKRHPRLYFVLQALLVSCASYFVHGGYPVVLISLYPILMGQIFAVFQEKSQIVLFYIFYYFMFCATVIYLGGPKVLDLLLLLFILMNIIVMALTNLYLKQIQMQHRTETFLDELETAHRRVEQLTVANERQRMARDLHDTLAQGVAGLIMQLEAVDAHLSKGNAERAHEIVRRSMDRARQTLQEARQAIDDLRSKSVSNVDFTEALYEEISRYEEGTGIQVKLELKLRHSLSKLITEHGLYMIRECLTNVAKHAGARQVRIRIAGDSSMVAMEIEDDGKGFDPEQIGKHGGHYGLTGMRERVRIIGGSFHIKSSIGKGTLIRLEAPLKKGDPV